MDKTKEVIKLYDQLSEKYSAAYDSQDQDKIFLDKFIAYLKEGAHILDLGCGTGRYSKYFFDRGFAVEGMDLSAGMLSIARKNYPYIKKMDMRKMIYGADTFDGIWAGYSIFHMSQDEFIQALSRIKKSLKPKGLFGLIFQEGEGEVEQTFPVSEHEKIYLQLYTFENMKQILFKNGFIILEKGIRRHEERELPYRKIFIVSQLVIKK